MYFSDFNGVIGQEVVPDKLKVFTSCEELEDLSIVIEELLLRWSFSSTKFLFHEFEELWVFFRWDWSLRIYK